MEMGIGLAPLCAVLTVLVGHGKNRHIQPIDFKKLDILYQSPI